MSCSSAGVSRSRGWSCGSRSPSVPPAGPATPAALPPMVLQLPVGHLDPVSRLTRIAAVTRAAKAGRDRHYRGVLASPLPTSLLRLGVRWLRRHGGTKVNLYVTNVPGPPQPLWLAGARLRTAAPIAPLVAGVPIAVAALSYAGELVISIQTDDAMTDPDTLARGLADQLDQLIAPGRVPATTGRHG